MKQSASYEEQDPHRYSSSKGETEKETAPLAPPTAPPYYGTFQGSVSYPQPSDPSQQYGHDTVQGYPVVEGTPMVGGQMQRLPCCGIGVGWFLFIIGWFLAAIPWFIGAFLLVCTRYDIRERMGLVFCTVAAILALIGASVGGFRAGY